MLHNHKYTSPESLANFAFEMHGTVSMDCELLSQQCALAHSI